MLTDSEKKWLAMRELRHLETGYYMPSFQHSGKTWYDFSVWTDWKAAAEFEARVAAWQADNLPSCDFCNWYEECFKTSCARTRLKHARIAVEEEMEKI